MDLQFIGQFSKGPEQCSLSVKLIRTSRKTYNEVSILEVDINLAL